MKTKLFFSILALVSSFSVKATDLIVEEFGIFPSYSSIAAAVAAASDGDRIFIQNRAGNVPWIENITISKSIELLSYAADTFFVVQGNYTIAPGSAGKTITIIGMRNTNGSITASIASPSGIRTNVNIMNCLMEVGSISIDANNYNTSIASNKINDGYVSFRYGRVIGNEITSNDAYALSLNAESSLTGDTTLIIGNKMINSYTSGYGIQATGTYNNFRIYNNFILHSYMGIYIYNIGASAFVNQIYNNTILADNTSGTIYGIYVSGSSAGSILEIMNNVLDETVTSTSYAIVLPSSGQSNIYYNHADVSFSNFILGTPTSDVNNTTNAAFSLTTDGHLVAGAPAIDGANPSPVFYDLDLTIGDAGAYGGSYTLNNYFPQFAGSARVYHVTFPRNVRQGSSLNIKADGFDR